MWTAAAVCAPDVSRDHAPYVLDAGNVFFVAFTSPLSLNSSSILVCSKARAELREAWNENILTIMYETLLNHLAGP